MTIVTNAIEPRNILKIVNALHYGGLSASFAFGTDTRPFSGKQCLVYVVAFPDDTKWSIRVPVHSIHAGQDAVCGSVEHEIFILRSLELGGFPWSPKLISHDSTFHNFIQFPYIISSWVPGTPLRWDDNTPACREDRDKIVRQIARIVTDLAGASQAPGDKKSVGFLTDVIDRKISRVLKGQVPNMGLRSCLFQRALVAEVFETPGEPTTTLISHEDLDPSNIIVDNEFNIKGIIDWGSARVLPAQLAIALPRFLAIEMWYSNDTSSLEVPEFSRTFLQPSQTRYLDRECLITSLSSIACKEESDNKYCSPSLARQMLSALSDPNVDWKRLLFESVFSRGTHSWMTKRSWLIGGIRRSSAEWSHGLELLTEKHLGSHIESFLRKMETNGQHLDSDALFELQGFVSG
ncbi:hypothetical protein B0T17DRAFT_546939 [Bombardia bombarda]|uniref:Aminoglycoside phosphotransferase domain-containing protein n=1 Tax=Bombardia bombarda TaxID=252184 RepID=A0AA39TJD2_9PEZI|nr:hypothetical protein B0T17DRAFT_546939 [Bombardia bombarda]